jgi:hypothetical protein
MTRGIWNMNQIEEWTTMTTNKWKDEERKD